MSAEEICGGAVWTASGRVPLSGSQDQRILVEQESAT